MIYGLEGMSCIIASTKIQKKTSKCKLINWLYKKIYGYKEVSSLPEGTDMIYLDGQLIFRSQEVFDKTTKTIGVKKLWQM